MGQNEQKKSVVKMSTTGVALLVLGGGTVAYAAPNTPVVNGLTPALLTMNPNLSNPVRLDRAQAQTDDMDHGYAAEQKAFDGGQMDKFVQQTGQGSWPIKKQSPNTVMDYYDGNTVTALWNYAQHFSMSDNSFGTTIQMQGKTIGDLLNAKNLTWGWFEGGYNDPTRTHKDIGGISSTDYIPHHNPFAFYPQFANPNHLPEASVAMIGHSDAAKHQYGLTQFWQAADGDNLPAVSFLKAAGYQDGHAGYSDPLDEQTWLVNTINKLEALPTWSSTAVFISWDDSDGWYDHVMGPLMNGSNDPAEDFLDGTGNAGTPKLSTYLDRAGYGPRLPMMVISPYARHNFVAHSV